jgi:hypothetical protein
MTSPNALTAESGQTAIYDPVPSSCDDSWVFDAQGPAPHLIEREVQKALLNVPHAHFSSLQVRRLPDGVCLTGVVRIDEGTDLQLDRLACEVAGVTRVLNHLVVQKCGPPISTLDDLTLDDSMLVD